MQVLGDRVSAGLAAALGDDGGKTVAAWFTAAVGAPCTLVRQLQGARSPVLGRSTRDRPRAPSVPSETPAAVDTASAASDFAESNGQAGGAEAPTQQADSRTGPAGGEPGLTSISSRGGGDSIGKHHVHPSADPGAPSRLTICLGIKYISNWQDVEVRPACQGASNAEPVINSKTR